MNQNENSFGIRSPAIGAGAAETAVHVHSGKADLFTLFTPGEERGQRICFITDTAVAALPAAARFFSEFKNGSCGRDIAVVIGSGERYKTIESALKIAQAALSAEFGRKDLFVAVGGGVISDITGFAASIFKRGAHLRFVPTTLLSMVDAAIGGKTGCDFNNYKNMIGSFFPAERIDFFPDFVQSLPESEYRSGLAEALKTALLYDEALFQSFQNESEKIMTRNADTLHAVIDKCARAKARVVEQDFTERGIRAHLNFGHTFGHALETLAGLGAITHGDAVAWGMGRALSLCAAKGICSQSYKDDVFAVLERYGWTTDALPLQIRREGAGKKLLEVMRKDKKNDSGKVKLVLQRGLCDTFTAETDDADILSVLE
ncbi:MAG: 3-dehydroquinate synthase [Treponema sp.]